MLGKTHHNQIILAGSSNHVEWKGQDMQHVRGEGKDICFFFIRKPKWKRPPGKPRGRWNESITVYIKQIGLKVVDWIQLAQDKDKWRIAVNTEMKLRVHEMYKTWLAFGIISSAKMTLLNGFS